MRRSRYSATVTLRLLPGAEPWVRVEYGQRWFKVPVGVALEEVLRGVEERWTAGPRRKVKMAPTTVRIPLAEWVRLRAIEDRNDPR